MFLQLFVHVICMYCLKNTRTHTLGMRSGCVMLRVYAFRFACDCVTEHKNYAVLSCYLQRYLIIYIFITFENIFLRKKEDPAKNFPKKIQLIEFFKFGYCYTWAIKL